RSRGVARLQEVAGADVRVLVAHAVGCPRATLRTAELSGSPGHRGAVDRGAIALQAGQREREERLAVLPRGDGATKWPPRGGRVGPHAQSRAGRVAVAPVPRRVETHRRRSGRERGGGSGANVWRELTDRFAPEPELKKNQRSG